VPYTGILSLHPEIDHCGPMARNVRDAALMLEAIAGPDGIDDRQPYTLSSDTLRFSSSLDAYFLHQPPTKPLQGLRVGVLKEGFEIARLESSVAAAVKSAIADLEKLGAEVKDVSVPAHNAVLNAWSTVLPLSGGREAFFGCGTGRKGLHISDKYSGPHPTISQDQFDAFGAGAQNLIMRYLYVDDKYGGKLHARAANAVRKARDAYDAALREADVLVMPTLPFPATKNLPPPGQEGSPGVLERLTYMAGTVSNTAPFDSTGHPALSVPVGWVPSPQDKSVRLPTGMQVVGRQFEDEVCLRVGMAWEKSKEWKGLEFGF
jgi:amidase